ncbi:Ff.00g118290.m01.CDS01 [Fusarium sp. VM40]|nr:Ff.00g118290.m01.CDS01 [Fusarium sp. VM40]
MDISSRDRAEALLLKAARAHGIPVAKDDVYNALADTAFVEWANLHLATDHLLTGDELALYTALDKSGQVDRLADLHDLGEVQAVNEEDIRAAIEELNRSTVTISKQTETLRQQQDALARLVGKRAEAESQRKDLEEERLNKTKHSLKKLIFEVDGEAQSLEYRVADLEQIAKDSRSNLKKTTDTVFQSDDKLLSSLQKLGWELEQQDPEEEKTIEKLRETSMRLIKTTVETLRTRLDRIYIEAILAAERSGDVKSATQEDVKALEEELESLYSEILPVAQMSTEQQHLEPALKSKESQSGQSLHRSAVAVSYVNECLDYLVERISLLTERVETLKSHNAAASSIIATAKAEVSASLSPEKKKSIRAAMPASPIRNPSPIRMRANTDDNRRGNNNNRRRSSGILDEPAIEALLRDLALSLPDSEEASIQDQVAALSQAFTERSGKTTDVVRNAQDNFEASVTSRLDDARLAIQLLRDSVLAESPYGEIKLVDPEFEGSIQVLAQEVNMVKEKLDGVAGKKALAKSVKKDEFVQRWAT